MYQFLPLPALLRLAEVITESSKMDREKEGSSTWLMILLLYF